MKDIQSQIKTYLIACGSMALVAIAFMTLPVLESTREAASAKIGLTAQSLWIPVAGLILLAFFATYKRLAAVVAKPINDLARHVREGESSVYNFQKKARNKEEIALKGYIQSHDLKVSEIKEQRDELEKDLKTARDERDIALSINNRQTTEIAELNQTQKKLRVESQTLAAAKEVLESALETERKTKVGREVKMRAEEIYSQVESAVSEASARAIWIPNLLRQIETPTTLINELSKRLESNWNELSIARLGEEIAEIRQQSDLQRTLLEAVDPDGLLPVDGERRTHVKHTIEEPVEHERSEILIGDNISFKPEPESHSEELVEPEPKPSYSLEPTSIEEALIVESKEDVVSECDAPIANENETDELPFEDEPSAIVEEATLVEPQPPIDPEALSALQALVFELVNDYSKEVEKISVEADLSEDLDVEVDEELLESVLSNLLEIAIYQWKEGSVKLRVTRQDNQITFAVDSKGKPLDYGELDESQSNRIASALDRKIDVDMPSEGELRMRYRYVHDEA